MSAINRRIEKLEKAGSHEEKKKFLCVTWDGQPTDPQGYKVQPCARQFGGTGGEPLYLKTAEELAAFERRADVELTRINVGYQEPE